MDRKKSVFWPLFSLALAGLSIWAVLAQSGEMSPGRLLSEIKDADKLWLAAAVVCGGLFIVLEGAAVCSILRGLGYRRTPGRGLLYSASDIYFSAITPSATGGQPASAFFMVRDGIPAGAVTVALLINLILYTVSIMALGLWAAVFHPRLLGNFRLMSKLLIVLGYGALAGLTAFFFTVLRWGGSLFGALERLLRFLHGRGLLRDLEGKLKKLDRAREDFKSCVTMTRGKTGVLRSALLWNLGQRAAQIAVPMCMHLALGGERGLAEQIFASQCLITIGYNCVPIPGGMGVADFLMLDGFSSLMDREAAFRLEMLSRGVAFYICAAVGGLITLAGYLLLKKRERSVKQ